MGREKRLMNKKNIKNARLIIPFAVLLLLINQILGSAVTPPSISGQPERYILFWVMFIFSSLGNNLIPLWLGKNATRFHVINVRKIITDYFFVCMTILLISLIVFKHLLSINFLEIFFPISSNSFQLGISSLILLIFSKKINELIDNLSRLHQIVLVFILGWGIFVPPILFNQSIFGISSSGNVLWVLFLYLVGRLAIQKDNRPFFLITNFICLIVFSVVLILLVKVRPIVDTSMPLQSKLFSSFAILPFAISFTMYNLLNYFENKNWLQVLKNKAEHYSIFISFIVYVLSNFSGMTSLLNSKLHVNVNTTVTKWLSTISFLFLSIVLIAVIFAFILNRINKSSFMNRGKNFDMVISAKGFLDQIMYIFEMKDKFRRAIILLITIISLVCFQFVSAYLASEKLSLTIAKSIVSQSLPQILLTVIICLFFFFLLLGIINRFWVSYFIFICVQIFISLAEFLKMRLRSEPILPTDLSMLSAVSDLSKMISPLIIVAAVVIIIVLIISGILIQRRADKWNKVRWSLKRRIFVIVCSLVFFGGSNFVNHNNSISKTIFDAFNVQWFFYDQATGAQVNGPIIQFVSNVDTSIMTRPHDYSRDKVESIMKKYNGKSKSINKHRSGTLSGKSIIFILSESFSNPNRVPNLKVTPNPVSYLLSLKKETTSGLMMSSGYGGGTANMEWETLTGLDLSLLSPTCPIPYTQLVPRQKLSPSFTNLFSNSIAIHPYNASLYNRKNVFKKFGFDKFYYQGSKYKLSFTSKIGTNPYVSDNAAYKETLKHISRSNNGSQFIQLSTMQNHMPFNNYYSNSNKYNVEGTGVTGANRQSVENYSQGINYTDKSLKAFIKSVDKIKRNVTVVWYGDHLAALYNGDSMTKYGTQLHETDYFIYNNKSHKIIESNTKVVSPYVFPALALEASDSKVTPYYALLTTVQQKLPAMVMNPSKVGGHVFGGSTSFINSNSKTLSGNTLSKSQKKILDDYKVIQYDLTAGKQYSANWAMRK